MNAKSADQPEISGAEVDAILAALERILQSEDFSAAPRLTSLLDFIVRETLAGRSHLLKGFNIANQVFGRDEQFDARTDPLVRVQANRMRKALERYYLLTGKDELLRITVPKGSYAAVFERKDDDAPSGAAPALAEPTVAVLPFKSIGSGQDQEYFADGITEELTVALAQVENFRVIATNSTQRFKADDVDAREIGNELNVRFVMQGAVQRQASALRVTAQLTDAQSGVQVWAERFDRKLETEDLFAIQDEITQKVITTISDAYGVIPRLLEKEIRGKRATDLESYDAVLRFFHYQANSGRETFKRARRGLELAVERNPDYAMALASLSEIYSDNYALHFDPPYELLDEAHDLARRAIALDPACQQAHHAMAMAQFQRRERPGCLRALERVLELNPNAPYYSGAAGWLMALVGDWERGLSILNESRARNPFHPPWFHVAAFQHHFMRGEYEDALAAAEHVKMPGNAWDPLIRAVALQRLGRSEEAGRVVDELLVLLPEFPAIAREYIGRFVFEPEHARDIHSALVEAGLPTSG